MSTPSEASNSIGVSDEIEAFDYQTSNEPDPIHFLSTVHREVPSRRFTRIEVEHILAKIFPGWYNVTEAKSAFSLTLSQVSSTKGMGSQATRFRKKKPIKVPPPNTYDLRNFPYEPTNPNKYPFNSSAPSRPKPPINPYPGPATYQREVELDRRIPFKQSFNGQKTMVIAVEVKCCAVNEDICKVCREKPCGDYWHLNKAIMCRPCMNEVKYSARNNEGELRRLLLYKRIRDCSFMHKHDRTSAPITLLNKKQLLKFQQREAYFSKYFDK